MKVIKSVEERRKLESDVSGNSGGLVGRVCGVHHIGPKNHQKLKIEIVP